MLAIAVPYAGGTSFEDCVRVFETSGLHSADRSVKEYCPGVGLVFDDGIALTDRNYQTRPLVRKPGCAHGQVGAPLEPGLAVAFRAGWNAASPSICSRRDRRGRRELAGGRRAAVPGAAGTGHARQ